MRKRWLIGLGVILLAVGGLGLYLALRPPLPQPRYLQIEKGMTWDQAEEIMGRPPYATLLTRAGTLQKIYADVDGLWISLDGDLVAEVEYELDNPNPTLFERVAKWLRL